MVAVLVVVALALLLVLPWAVAFGGLPHGFTAAEGAFLAVLTLFGLGYAWRRGVLRWQ
jgi:NADH:ubiquinone oxidoreductase subunit 3 (subunit A)